MKFKDQLKKLEACNSAIEWVGNKTTKQAWDACEKGSWMLWLISKTNPKVSLPMRKKLVLCACDIAETSLKHVKAGETRPAEAIRLARAWANGEKVTQQEVETAAYAANAAYSAYAANAANAAANAAYAAANAANAAYSANAANAAYAAANAAYAEIVRKYFKTCPKIKA